MKRVTKKVLSVVPAKRILSGIQPSGVLHIGNYLGGIKSWTQMQNSHTFIMIADLHAMTSTISYSQTLKTTKLLLACGLDPSKCTIFQQSLVPAHSQLYWILSNYCSVGELFRMTQWKSKSEEKRELAGLLTYPILQAADILLYNPHFVPVGEDQKQHLELTNALARKLNREIRRHTKTGIVLTSPKAIMSSNSRVKALRNPESKMSKSDENQNNCIFLTDKRERIQDKVNKAITDSELTLDNLENRPGMLNLIQIIAGCKDIPTDQVLSNLKTFEGPRLHSAVKREAAIAINATVEPILEKFSELNNSQVEQVLQEGSHQASLIANDTLKRIYQGLKIWK